MLRDAGYRQLMRRSSVRGNGFVNDGFDLFEDDGDDQVALAIGITIDGRDLEFESAQQVVASQRETATELDEARLAPQVNHECFQIMDVSLGQLCAQAIDVTFILGQAIARSRF